MRSASLPVLLLALFATLSFAQSQDATRADGAKQTGQATIPPDSRQPNAPQKTKPAESDPEVSQVVEAAAETKKLVREGIAVEFDLGPLDGKSRPLREGQDGVVRFRITDAANGAPLAGLRPSAWLDLRPAGRSGDAKQCHEKIQSFLQGSLSARPVVDLNSYYVLALNEEPNISVIDPLLGFGGSKLYALVSLKSPGHDWVLSRDQKRLFVSLPASNEVAMIDTATWKVTASVDAGRSPARLALQPDEKYLWVGNDAGDESAGGVTVLDAASGRIAARIPTGGGRHEILVADNRHAYVTDSRGGTLSVIDVARLRKVKDIKIGASPGEMAFSPLSGAVYVVDEREGTIVVVDGKSHEIAARIRAKPGVGALRFSPDGRWGFAANRKENLVHVIDSSSNRLVHSVEAGKEPDQISFTRTFAYVRSSATADVRMIRLSTLGGDIDASTFPGGQNPPGPAPRFTGAKAIVPAPGDNSVVVANPADKAIYFYAEGMAAPMGNFQNYRREPKAALVLDRSLRETTPGDYSTAVKLPQSGTYDVAFLLDSPRIYHCFTANVGPGLHAKKKNAPLKVEFLTKNRTIPVGEAAVLRFRLTDPSNPERRVDSKDIGILAFSAAGGWRTRVRAQPSDDGAFEAGVSVPRPGVYYVFVEGPSLPYGKSPYLVLQAEPAAGAGKKQSAEK